MKIIDRKDGKIMVSYTEEEFERTQEEARLLKLYKQRFLNKYASVHSYINYLMELDNFMKEWYGSDREEIKED